VFGANDCMTIGALSAFRAAGLRVPEDIAVAGFDDIPMAQYVDPALTSVHVDISELGRRATDRLLDVARTGTSTPAATDVGYDAGRPRSCNAFGKALAHTRSEERA
jgi:LacI family transcriptional regulator